MTSNNKELLIREYIDFIKRWLDNNTIITQVDFILPHFLFTHGDVKYLVYIDDIDHKVRLYQDGLEWIVDTPGQIKYLFDTIDIISSEHDVTDPYKGADPNSILGHDPNFDEENYPGHLYMLIGALNEKEGYYVAYKKDEPHRNVQADNVDEAVEKLALEQLIHFPDTAVKTVPDFNKKFVIG